MMNEPKRELLDVSLLEPWELNPRGNELRGIPEFAAQIEHEGGIREDLHVFMRNSRAVVMQGHRRLAVSLRLGIAQVWCKVYQITEAEAFLHLLTLQNGCDPFDSRELALAARTAVHLGIERMELTGAMHRDEETVQLYLDLGRLPHRAQEKVYKGQVPLKTARSLLRLLQETDRETVEGVLPMLENSITGEPMTEEQARVFLDVHYFEPLKQKKKWLEMMGKLAKKSYRVCDGYSFVGWEQRDQFVMEGAIPQTLYARAEEHIDAELLCDAGKPMTWGALAVALGVPVFVAPAPEAKGGYLVLVRMGAVKDADSTREEKVLHTRETRKKKFAEEQLTVDEGRGAPLTVVDGGLSEEETEEETEEEEEAGGSASAPFDLERWRRVLAALLGKKEAVMQDALWKPLVCLQWEALAPLLPPEIYAAMMGEMNADEAANRRGLRWCYLALMALALHEGNAEEMEAEIVEIEGELGVGQ
jgi:hypothetical protein